MDRALELASADIETGQARQELSESLAEVIEGPVGRRKTVRLLSNVWLSPHEEAYPLLDDARSLRASQGTSTLPLHWGMSMAAYPFFMAVAEAAGRLLRLHEAFDSSQVKQRVQETYGERSTVERAVQRVLQCLVEWEALLSSTRSGQYRQSRTLDVESAHLRAWLLEALLRAKRTEAADLSALTSSPALFPFRMSQPGAGKLVASGRLKVHREGAIREAVFLSSHAG
jgi:hypothetical protein